MKDRDLAYWQNVQGLKISWGAKIAEYARAAVKVEPDAVYAADLVASKLLNSVRWENVAAADISDIAYEAVIAAGATSG